MSSAFTALPFFMVMLRSLCYHQLIHIGTGYNACYEAEFKLYVHVY